MAVRLYDTLSREPKTVAPAKGAELRFYCCGPTVYGPAHIGNFRTFVLQDTLRRVLEVDGQSVRHVRNITDVDDKTIRRSQEEGASLRDFTTRWTEKFSADCEALNLLPPHHEPRATEHVSQMVAMIERLVQNGNAYVAEDGSVYFKVASFAAYGKLAHLNQDELRTQLANSAGERNQADEYERESISDFALWKAAKPDDGENRWDSPWGPGRPGWHIECSAMSTQYLGESFDLHGGGVDLCFPHHENEIAQSECATGCAPFAAHWFHSAHLMVEGKKMSKSLGNLYTLDDLAGQGWQASVVRWALLNGHYRQQLNFTQNGLHAAASALEKLAKSVARLLEATNLSEDEFLAFIEPNPMATTGVFEGAWEALANDLNVPAAIGEMFSALADLAADKDFSKVAVIGQLRALGGLLYALGITLFERSPEEAVPPDIEELARQRWNAKKNRDFAEADRLRDEVTRRGWKILDSREGYTIALAD